MQGIDALLNMDTQSLYTGFAVVGLPYVLSVILKTKWPTLVKHALQWLAVIVATIGYLFAADKLDLGNGKFDFRQFFRMALIVLVGSQIWYKLTQKVQETLTAKTS